MLLPWPSKYLEPSQHYLPYPRLYCSCKKRQAIYKTWFNLKNLWWQL